VRSARAERSPDGYKLLVVTSGDLTAAPNLTKASYSLDSFAFIARISSKPYGLVVRTAAPWKTAAEMLRAIGENPNKYTIGTAPRGGMFLTAQHFIVRGNVRLTAVSYGGAGPALTGLLGSQIDSVWAPLAAAESHIRAGSMRVLAVSGDTRQSGYPDVPTFKELGIAAPYVQWVGIVAPRDVPADRIAFLRDAFARIVKEPSYVQIAQKFAIDIAYAPAGEFEKQVRDEDAAFKALVKDLGLTPK
jgi:tripartite-type tricarboxylate transporter receptor subunit TctC